MKPFIIFFVAHDSLNGETSTKPSKGTLLHHKTSYDIHTVKIGHVTKGPKKGGRKTKKETLPWQIAWHVVFGGSSKIQVSLKSDKWFLGGGVKICL